MARHRGSASWLCIVTSETIWLSADQMQLTEGNKSLDDIPDLVWKSAELARQFLHSADYLRLPSPRDIFEYQIMVDVCKHQTNDAIRIQPFDSITGKGTCQRFKGMLHHLRMHDEWHSWKAQHLKAVAMDWCREHGIEHAD